MIAWRLETQCIGLPYQITYPKRDQDLKRLRGFEVAVGFNWSCEPQFASVSAVGALLSIGNLTKD